MIKLHLYNRLDKAYERKNLYLKELAEAYESEDNIKVKDIKLNKKNHNYSIQLKEYKLKEKNFLRALKQEVKKLEVNKSKRLNNLEIRYYKAQKMKEFYEKYIDFCYDAEYFYNVSTFEVKEIPKTIKNITFIENDIIKQKEVVMNIKSSDSIETKENLKKFKTEQKITLKKKVAVVKKKLHDKIISPKAYSNSVKELKRRVKENYTVKTYELPDVLEKKKLKNNYFDLKTEYKKEVAYINENISEIRRNTPVEVDKINKFTYLAYLFPGIGQIINGQKTKGKLMLLLSVFVYLMAIPYALGFGNYRGDGISGLISLAEGAGKLDRSIIFMIEGVIALFLVAIAVAVIMFNIKDIKNTVQEKIKGVRENNWYETKIILSEDGFPFIVTIPTLITIIFIVIVPITTSVLISFTGMDPSHQAKFGWEGLKNYKMLIEGRGVAGGPFWRISYWTILWTLFSTSLAIFIGFSLALILHNDRIKFKRLFRSVFLLPWAVPAFITILFFSILFGSGGELTKFLGGIQVKNSTMYARITLILMQGWLGSAYVFLLSTGVLQSIPEDLYEAADIDGSTKWQKLRRITLPIILFQTAPLLVGQFVFNFNNFSIIYLFNGGGPYNPAIYGNIAGTTDLLISYVFKLTIEQQYQSIGSAIIFVVSLGLMFFAFLGFINSKAFKEERL